MLPGKLRFLYRLFLENKEQPSEKNSAIFKHFKENDNTLKFAKHVSTETSVIFS